MLGAIVGDIVGSRFEFNNHKSKEFELFTDECFVTDDSIMSLAVAKALMETEYCIEPHIRLTEHDHEYLGLLKENSIRYMREIGKRYPGCGFGGMFSGWIFSEYPKPYGSYGNGAAMRISPAGYAARTKAQVRLISRVITSVTHDHIEGLKGAEAVAMAVFMARSGYLKSEILNKINLEYYPIDFAIDSIRDGYSFDETCQETVPQAIQCFIESESFEDAIRIAISLGGDSDTVAAITGSIAGAFYGVPDDIKKRALTYLDEELLAIYNEWEEFIGEEEYRFRILTKYIPYFNEEYDANHEFIEEIYQFAKTHPEYEMFSYRAILAQMGFEPDKLDIDGVDFEDFDKRGTLAFLQYITRAEHFAEGTVHEYILKKKKTELLKYLHGLDCAGKERKLAEVILAEDITSDYYTFHFVVSGKKIINHTNEWYRTLSINESKKFLTDWKNLQTEHWKHNEDPPFNCKEPTHWLLYARYEGSRGSIFVGYKENPDKWKKLSELVGLVEHIEPKKERNPGDLIFCSVEFFEEGNTYYYLTEDEGISIGDRVVVPAGSGNIEKIAYITEIEYHQPEEAPFPLDKTKHIIRRASETDELADNDQSMTLYSSSNENGSTVVWARIEDGCLEIEGQDLGPYIPYGDGEYEYFYSFDSNETRRFSELLTGQSEDLDVFLKAFAGKIKGPGWYDELMHFCKEHGLEYSGFSC